MKARRMGRWIRFVVVAAWVVWAAPRAAAFETNDKADGYRGIWFPLGQQSVYGDKYSGGLGTYTAKHVPLAVHAPEVNKTFFVYGGAPAPRERRLLILASEYDHATHTVPKPTIVLDKTAVEGKRVDDPHDNPALVLDEQGFLWVFVSGRSTHRQDYTFRSTNPYSADSFERVEDATANKRAYPQVFHSPGAGLVHLFTKYRPGRELFVRTSTDGRTWTPALHLASMEGHYQVSWERNGLIGTMFNRHPGKGVDERTDLFYLQTPDFGSTWTTVDGQAVSPPLVERDSPARVVDGLAADILVYLNDLTFDANGNPILFYTTAAHASGPAHQPGPFAEPRRWTVSAWDGSRWQTRPMPTSATRNSTVTHNYDTGCLLVDGETWRVVGPTGAPSVDPGENPKRYWGQGGEIEVWETTDRGATWSRVRRLTRSSPRNHGYVRRTRHGADRFSIFWADGNPETPTESHLYFGNRDGSRYWELPYTMDDVRASPVERK